MMNFCGHLRISDNVSAESPQDGVISLLDDKENPHNRIKWNRLCGLIVLKRHKNKEVVFRGVRVFRVNEKYPKYPIYPKYPHYTNKRI